jgi:hypothetical protein
MVVVKAVAVAAMATVTAALVVVAQVATTAQVAMEAVVPVAVATAQVVGMLDFYQLRDQAQVVAAVPTELEVA